MRIGEYQEVEMVAEGGPFRVRLERAQGRNTGCCLLAQSGRLGRYDEPGEEAEFLESLTQSLVLAGVSVVRLDLGRRENLGAPADERHIELRMARLRRVLCGPELEEVLRPHVLLGISLGAESILRLISSPSPPLNTRGVILASCVVDQPRTVFSDLQEVHLLYGNRDHVVYLSEEDGSPKQILSPDVYGVSSAGMLVLRPRQCCRVHIVEGVGHLLTYREEGRENPALACLKEMVESLLLADLPSAGKAAPVLA